LSIATAGTGAGLRLGWRPLARGASRERAAWALGGLAAAVIAGVAVAHPGQASHLVLAAEAGAALFVVVGRLGAASLLIWAVATAVLYPFLRVPSDHPIITFDRVWILASLSCVLLAGRRIGVSRPTRVLLLAFGWLAIAFGLRAVTTRGPNLGFDAVTLWLDAVILPLILFVAAAKLTVSEADARRIGGALALAGVALALIGLAEKVVGFELASYSRGSARFDQAIGTVRISGPYSAPEPYALTLLICIAATLYWIQVRRPRPYLLGGLALLLETTALSLTFFRAAWIAGAVVLVVLLSRPGRHARTLFIVMYATAFALLAFVQLQGDRQFATRVNNTRNIDARFAAYQQGIQIFKREPIYGVGIDQYPIVAATLPETTVNGVASVPNPHDSYLGVLAEQGVLGAAPLLAATGAVWFALRRFRRRMTSRDDVVLLVAVRGCAIAYLLLSLPLYMFPYSPPNCFLALVLGAAVGRFEALRR
jgi:O-antigen ligase